MNHTLLIKKYFIKVLILTIFFISLPAISQAKASLIPICQQELSEEKRLTEEEINKLIEETKQLTSKPTRESLTLALIKYERLLLEYKFLNDKKKQAIIYERVTQIKLNLGDINKALEDIKQLLEIYQALGDKQAEAKIHISLGVVYGRLGEEEKQLESYKTGLSIFQALGDKVNEASVLYFLGLLLENNGELDKALEHYHQVLLLRETTSNHQGKLTVLSKISQIYLQIGKSQKALEFIQKALELEKETGNATSKSVLIYQMGTIYFVLKDYVRARDFYQESLALARLAKDVEQEAFALNAIGRTYVSMEDTQERLKYYLQAIAVYKNIGKSFELPSSFIGVAVTYNLLGDYKKAEEYLKQALEISQRFNDRATEANALYFIGIAKLSTNDLNEATECFNKSLELYEKTGYLLGKIKNLYQLALLERKKDLPKAIRLIEEALEIIETFRSNINSQELGESYFDKIQNYYDLYIDLLVELDKKEQKGNFVVKALEINEKRRARNLREILTEAKIDIREGVNAQLLEKEKEIQIKLSIKDQQKRELLTKKTSIEKLEKLDKEIRDLIYQRKETQAQIKASSPAFAALTQIQDVSLPTIQNLLDENTILLEYSLGKDNSYLWLVTSNSVKCYKLTSSAEIEKQAQIVYKLLVNRDLYTNLKTTSSLESEYKLAVSKLSELILVPVSSQLENKRLLVVADGMLQYIPFSILSKNNSLDKTANFTPLILENEVINLPSAATLLLLREKKENSNNTITIIADPVFTSSDPRIKQQIVKNTNKQQEDKTKRESNLLAKISKEREINNINDLSRLPFSRQEATTIAGLLAKENYQQFLDFDADYDLLTRGKLSSNKVLHFATHSIINNVYPELSGIVLSLVDREGKPKNGFLQLQEIYNLKFSADLVVLSACQTALGKEIKGEGLVGLTRGFMYAGAKQVIASLWKVDDRATAELMKYFYQNLFKNNQSPSQALREAQLQMMKQPRWKSPYYWAAFVLQGDFQ